MKTEIDLDAIVIDGARLKAAREARNASIAEMAAAITLSREQIQHIEDGGNRPFYTPAHKLLAVRKYAAALEIPYEEIVIGPGADQTIPVPEDAPVAMMSHADTPEPADLRLAAVERNAEVRRMMTMGAIALCILLAVYAKVRGNQDDIAREETETSVSSAQSEEKPEPAPVAESRPAPAVVAESSPKLSESKAAAAAPAEAKPEAKSEAAPKTEKTETKLASDNSDDCSARSAGDIKTWSPAYQRKSDSRLFVVSPRGGSVCIVDANGKATQLSLKPMVGQAFSGKPPYVVKSAELSKMEMYLQGLRVKIPNDAEALKLVPTSQQAPPADATNNADSPST